LKDVRNLFGCAVVLGALSCRSQPPCPPDAVIELLHDAVFHLDQGDDDARVRSDLSAVRSQMPHEGPAAVWARGFADRMQAALASDGGRRFDAETLRADLHMSACLPKELHRRLHQRLPPLP
jgi:hypothetical protein